MNVLILTPDRVGSTLLQRLVTVYMLRQGFDKPVINLHELTNGLTRYYHNDLNCEVLGKPEGTEWGYYQTLPEIEQLLKGVDHYKTSRMAHYHLIRRQDSINDQIKFYDYLNKHFYIISCRRDNIFEYALSWCIRNHSKKLNVYSATEKVAAYESIYKKGIFIHEPFLFHQLNMYKQYIEWCDNYFGVQSVFNYERDVHNIEDYILNLDFMNVSPDNTWQAMFGQSFSDFNTCHKLIPDLQLHGVDMPGTNKITVADPALILRWEKFRGTEWPDFENATDDVVNQLPETIQQEIQEFKKANVIASPQMSLSVTEEVAAFLKKNISAYKDTYLELNRLTQQGFLVGGVPIKLQSLKEKKRIIKNFSQCIEWYNTWVEKNNFGTPYTESQLESLQLDEEEKLQLPIVQYNLLT